MSDNINERRCVSLRCGKDCWGLPGCEHPDRTPFYLKRLPTIEELERRERNRRLWWRTARIAVVLLSMAEIAWWLYL